MAANLDFCRRCEASYTPSDGDTGMCPTCDEQSEAIAEQLREAEELRDALDELDAEEEMGRDFYEDEQRNQPVDDGRWGDYAQNDCDGNPPYMDNHYPVG